MADMSPLKVKMPELDPQVRNKNFEEVAMGYTKEMALAEANRCLVCKNPMCVSGCPVNVKIPDFIKKITQEDFEGAYLTITETNSLPSICGRVCPQECQCEGKCVRGIKGESVAIGRLERFVADYYSENFERKTPEITPNGKKVAVVGSGPAGLTCAGDLSKLGYDVTIFEAFHTSGGVLVYGIPEFRLPNSIVDFEINNLEAAGVKFVKDCIVGKTLSIAELEAEGCQGVFVASGAGLPNFMGIPGENSINIMSSNEYLTRVNLMDASNEATDTPIPMGRNVVVVGGGNTAMDSVRTALRLGAERAMIIYRRSEAEMPARIEEVHHAKQEGVEFRTLQNAKRILGDEQGRVNGIECLKYELGEPDASGRRSPVAVEGSEFTLDVDTVVVAVGNASNPLIPATTEGLEVNKRGNIVVNPETNQTSIPGVFAGGDIVLGAATVILAMGEGRRAAAGINAYLSGK